jgi:acyl-CoA synthetase (AMP-forming)/AMP-acid ligase II
VCSWFPTALREHGDRPALLGAAGTVTYAELADRVDAVVERLGPVRRLVLLAGAHRTDAVVHYLAALAGGHPLILVAAENGDALDRIADAYDPDVIVRPADRSDGWQIDEIRPSTRHTLHPELALLLSTSGSTGSPKLVRLSQDNVASNAASIATYLGIEASDRAMTSLPMTYCYGLSVLNSHLARGASVVLTDRSVIEPAFWVLFRRTRATSFAGVPYTFDLLDRVGFAELELPDLRYVTQAGGRLDPETVRRYAELGERDGWQLYVMYGQTEATARMAYLPPDLATTRPEAIGVPIPGGSIRLDPFHGAADGAGEIVYRGPNVMLGYAEGPGDLALGRSIDELRTGDLGRRGEDGLYEIVGRRSGFVKIAGLRIDPEAVERHVERLGIRAAAVGTDAELVVFTERGAPPNLDASIRAAMCVPVHALRIVTLPELPRLPNGKLDRQAMRELAAAPLEEPARVRDVHAALRDLYARALGHDVSDGDSFAGMGGDSLSYVEVTLGLEEILGRLPDAWATMSLRELADLAPASPEPQRRWAPMARWRSVETSVALRAIAIVLVVTSHIGMFVAPGGAHVLMAVAGFNFARFRLTTSDRPQRVRGQLRAVARIAIPAIAWVAAVMLLTDEYELRHLFLVNALVHDQLWGNLWFIELLVYIGLLMAALLAIPAFDRAERRWPFAIAMAVVAVGLVFRFEIVDFGIPYTMPVLWLFALGWAASRAAMWWQRGLVLLVALVAIPGFFDSVQRNAVIAAGVALLILVPHLRVPGPLARVGGVLASASLAIYLVHWEVWPLFDGWYGVPSLVASLAAGIGLWLAVSRGPGIVARAWDRAREPRAIGRALPRHG